MTYHSNTELNKNSWPFLLPVQESWEQASGTQVAKRPLVAGTKEPLLSWYGRELTTNCEVAGIFAGKYQGTLDGDQKRLSGNNAIMLLKALNKPLQYNRMNSLTNFMTLVSWLVIVPDLLSCPNLCKLHQFSFLACSLEKLRLNLFFNYYAIYREQGSFKACIKY